MSWTMLVQYCMVGGRQEVAVSDDGEVDMLEIAEILFGLCPEGRYLRRSGRRPGGE